MKELSHYRELGKKAAGRRAERLNAANANEAAATMTAHEAEIIGNHFANSGRTAAKLQRITQTSLFDLLDLSDADRQRACAAFAAGCFEWLEENPD